MIKRNELRRAVWAAFALALLTIAASQAHAGGAIITIKNFDFAPMTLTVPAGTSVTWKNLDEEPHTVTSVDGAFRSGAIDGDESYTFKFDKPGAYKYVCSIHPKMRAVIIVK